MRSEVRSEGFEGDEGAEIGDVGGGREGGGEEGGGFEPQWGGLVVSTAVDAEEIRRRHC